MPSFHSMTVKTRRSRSRTILDAALFLCDEFNQLGLIHASLLIPDSSRHRHCFLFSFELSTYQLPMRGCSSMRLATPVAGREQLRAASSLLARRALTPRLSPLDLGHLCKLPYPTPSASRAFSGLLAPRLPSPRYRFSCLHPTSCGSQRSPDRLSRWGRP